MFWRVGEFPQAPKYDVWLCNFVITRSIHVLYIWMSRPQLPDSVCSFDDFHYNFTESSEKKTEMLYKFL